VKKLIAIGFFLILTYNSFSQKEVQVLQADVMVFDQKIAPDAQRLVGFVVLELDGVTLSCDSVYLYQESNNFEAFDNVHINQGDSIHLYGDYLKYSHKKRQAILEKNVLFNDNEMTLRSNLITYDLEKSTGSYLGGGTITSTENENTLTSQIGTYDSENEMFYFKNKVKLTNPEYTVISDTLNYSNSSEIAYFFGPTTITGEDSKIYCENGWYNTQNEICQFSQNAIITTESRILKGDSIHYDGLQKIGQAFRNVSISDSLEKFIITGNYGFHHQEKDSSFVTGRALFTQEFDTDSLHLHADTLLAQKDSLKKNMIKAFHNVKFYKSDMQGKADSLIWLSTDSLLHMFTEPIVWNNQSQMTADTITISMKDEKIDQIFARKNALLITDKGANKFDQIKGRSLVGNFRENELETLTVNGNGQAIYYPAEEKDTVTIIKGVNKLDCSDIIMYLENNDIQRISFLNQPKGAFIPLKDAVPADEILEGFIWREAEKPTSVESLLIE